MAADLDIDTGPSDTAWSQATVRFDDYATAEHVGATQIGPLMTATEDAGLITCWWFVRKNPYWRLRWLPAPHAVERANQVVRQALNTMRDNGTIADATVTCYEPEIHAFGGNPAMDIAHSLFHADSRHILHHLNPDHRSHTGDKRRELTVLLCSVLMRAAGQDWFEQGDIWARVAENRPLTPETPPDRVRALESGLRRLMTVDAGPGSPLVGPNGTLAHAATWSTAFHTAGNALGPLAHNGTLRRGLRSVLAHHVLFHWNRLGLPRNTQSVLAHVAQNVVLGG